MSQELERIELHRTKIAPAFFLILAGILLTIGCLVLFISFEVGDYLGLSGIIFRWGISLAIIGIASWLAWRSICQIRTGSIVIDSEKIQFIEDGKIEKEIYWNDEAHVNPLFNHALGFNAFYGFRIKQNKIEISASPDEGWPLSELKRAIVPLVNYTKEKNGQLSKDFNLIDWIEINSNNI